MMTVMMMMMRVMRRIISDNHGDALSRNHLRTRTHFCGPGHFKGSHMVDWWPQSLRSLRAYRGNTGSKHLTHFPYQQCWMMNVCIYVMSQQFPTNIKSIKIPEHHAWLNDNHKFGCLFSASLKLCRKMSLEVASHGGSLHCRVKHQPQKTLWNHP